MEQFNFVGLSPESLKTAISDSLKKELEQIRKEFQPKQPTEYLTRQDLADLLKVDLSTVHNWTKSGKLVRYGIGNRVYYKREEVETAMQPLKS